jgi:hypothetical protein
MMCILNRFACHCFSGLRWQTQAQTQNYGSSDSDITHGISPLNRHSDGLFGGVNLIAFTMDCILPVYCHQ